MTFVNGLLQEWNIDRENLRVEGVEWRSKNPTFHMDEYYRKMAVVVLWVCGLRFISFHLLFLPRRLFFYSLLHHHRHFSPHFDDFVRTLLE